MKNRYNYYSPALLNVDGTLVTVSCMAKAGREWGYNRLVCERQTPDGEMQKTYPVCAPPARVINDSPENMKTAFFAAPSLARAADGSLVLTATLFPESKGAADKKLLEKKKLACAYCDGKRCPLIYDRDGNFFYILDDGSVLDKHKQPTEYTVKPLGELYKGEEYIGNIYLNGAKGKPDEENKTTHGAPLKAPKRSYILVFRSTDGGVTWSAPRDITPMLLGEKDMPWLTTVPGRALTTESGRIIVPLTDGTEDICIYSDDNGETWCRNQRQPFTGTRGDWVVFETPSRHIYGYAARKGKLSSAMSPDNGIIWTKGDKPKIHPGKAPMSVLVLGEQLLLSHAGDGEGVIEIADFITDRKGNFKGLDWRKESARLDASIGSSCLAEIDDETVAIAYEDTEKNDITIQFIKMK